MQGFRSSPFAGIPVVVKNLLIINGLFFLASVFVSPNGQPLAAMLGLFYIDSPFFEPYQIITHMFMHGGFTHIFFNMFALWMFGSQLEQIWGPKRFLTYYMLTGLGAAALHMGVMAMQVQGIAGMMTGNVQVVENGFHVAFSGLESIYSTPTVGASGAIFGLLLAFGMLFPNTELMLIFLPIPIKAKYFVILYGLAELFFGIAQIEGDNIAHFAHLGGMLFGFILIKLWQKDRRDFY